MIAQYATALLLIAGALFYVIAAFGTLRFPDLYTRMHAATKGSAFGLVLMMLGVAVHFRDIWVTTEALLVVVFIFMTAPIAGYAIARAAHTLRTPMAKETVIDELMEREKEINGDITREQ